MHNTIYHESNSSALDEHSNGLGLIVVGVSGGGVIKTIRRGLFKWNLTAFWDELTHTYGSTINITKVSIQVKSFSPAAQPHMQLDLHLMEENWGAGDSNASTSPELGVPSTKDDASWIWSMYPSTPWQLEGGTFTEQSTAELFTTSGTQSYSWHSNRLIAQFKLTIQEPDTFFGWVIKAHNESNADGVNMFMGTGDDGPVMIVEFTGNPPLWLWCTVGITCGILFLSIFVFMYHKSRPKMETYTYETVRDLSSLANDQPLDIQELFSDPSIKVIPTSSITYGKIIGSGATGAVFSATIPHDQQVAAKKVNLSGNEQQINFRAFFDEIRIMSAAAHPNILHLVAIAVSQDLADVVLLTPLIDGGSLADAMFKTKTKFSFSQKVDIASQIAYGMHYLHSMRPRIIHRDLKPDNILITKSGSIKIADFGMSKMLLNYSKTMTTSGTPNYMAPETISDGKASEKVDIYAYGIILWELYTEVRPYEGVGPFQIMYKVINEGLRPEIPSDCPPRYAALIEKCIQLEPNARPSFKEIISELKTLQLSK